MVVSLLAISWFLRRSIIQSLEGETPIWDEYVYNATNARIKELYLGYTFDKLIRGTKVSVALTQEIS